MKSLDQSYYFTALMKWLSNDDSLRKDLSHISGTQCKCKYLGKVKAAVDNLTVRTENIITDQTQLIATLTKIISDIKQSTKVASLHHCSLSI